MIKREDNKFFIKTRIKNIDFSALFMKRMMKVVVWLKKRYGIEYEDAYYDHQFLEDDKSKGLITIIITFNG